MIKVINESEDININAIANKFIDDQKYYTHSDPNEVKKRIAKIGEFDNGHVIHGDWKKMSVVDSEEMARDMSIKDPDNIYYVQYDDLMIGASDVKWKNGHVIND